MFQLSDNSYGTSQVRLLKVSRRSDRHELKDLTVSVAVEGSFASAHTAGDNAELLDARTMENTVFALAKNTPPEIGEEQIEQFGQRLADYFLDNNSQFSRVHVDLAEAVWERLPVGPRPHHYAFRAEGRARRTAHIAVGRDGVSIESGFADLELLRTATEAFEGFKQDPFASAQADSSGVFACRLRAGWLYAIPDVPFALYYQGARQLLLEAFAEHHSHSPQHLLYTMGEALLSGYDEVAEVRLGLEQMRYSLADLSRFGLDNRDELFAPSAAPCDRFEVTVRREAPGKSTDSANPQ